MIHLGVKLRNTIPSIRTDVGIKEAFHGLNFTKVQFALEHTLNALHTVTFEVEQMVATNQNSLLPFI